VTALGRDAASVAGQAAAFAVGSGSVLALLGLGASALGEQLLLAEAPLQWLFPAVAVLMGLSLLGLLPFSLFGLRSAPELPSWVPRELQGFCLGVASALGASPCATPVLVTVVSYLASHPQGPAVSGALFLSYALGYSAPLALAAASAGSLPLLRSGGRLSPTLAGTAILALGTAQIAALCEEPLLGASAQGLPSLAAAAAVAAALAASLATAGAKAEEGAGASEVLPVPGEVGVYMYRPAAAASAAAAAAPDPDTSWWAREFRVDGIPHLAFVRPDGQVATALVGDVPAEILRANVEALKRGAQMPFVMFDAFEGGRKPLAPPSPP